MKKKELQELIKQGEGYFVEFKKQVGETLDREMVAFAKGGPGVKFLFLNQDSLNPGYKLFAHIRMNQAFFPDSLANEVRHSKTNVGNKT